jgi:hypothetical protein
LAKQLKPLLFSEGELNACGHVLLVQGKVKEALTIFRINAATFFESPDVYASLAEGLAKDRQHREAIENAEYALSINKNASNLKTLLDMYYKVRAAGEGMN